MSSMVKLIGSPTRIPVKNHQPIVVQEFIGLINTGDTRVSIAQMKASSGWAGPAQCPRFHEYILVLRGVVRVEHADGFVDAGVGQAVHAPPNEWVQYSTPDADGAEWVAVCTPPFSAADANQEKAPFPAHPD